MAQKAAQKKGAAKGAPKGTRPTEAERPASEAHSFMEMFGKLERDYVVAVQKKDKTALDHLLAPEFILRSADDPEHPILRDAWLNTGASTWDIRSYSHRTMSVRAFADSAIVNFSETRNASHAGKDASGDYFVVDLWVVNQGDWQLAARYIARAAKAGATR